MKYNLPKYKIRLAGNLTILVLLFFVSPFYNYKQVAGAATVVFDAAGSGITSGSNTSCFFNITIGSGSSRAIGIGLSFSDTSAVTNIAVTVGGVSAGLVSGSDSTDAMTSRSVIYALANPPSGSQTVNATWTNSTYASCGAVSVTGADQSTPMNNGTFNSSFAGSSSASVSIASISGDLTLDTVADKSGITPLSSNQTAKWGPSNNTSQIGYGGAIGAGTGSVTHIWNLSGVHGWTISGANFKQASGTPPPADTAPPSVPSNLSANAISQSQINLTWTSSTDAVGVTGYKIYRGGVQIGTTITNNYNDNGLNPSTLYNYTVSAYDAAGNTSSQSSSASATTQSGQPVPGDLNSDHIVNALDYSLLNSKWLQNFSSYDLQVDGLINSLDFAILSSNWGRTW